VSVFFSLTVPVVFEDGDGDDGDDGDDGGDDGDETAGLVPGVAPVCFSAHPIVRTARLKEAQRNNVENGFIGQAPPQWINKSGNILESPKKNKMQVKFHWASSWTAGETAFHKS
jgi:hypothetical protein